MDSEKTLKHPIDRGFPVKEPAEGAAAAPHHPQNEIAATHQAVPESLMGWDQYKERLHAAGVAGLDHREKMHLMHLTARSLGVGVETLAQKIAEMAARCAQLEATGQQVTDLLRELVSARPAAAGDREQFTEPMAQPGAQGPSLRLNLPQPMESAQSNAQIALADTKEKAGNPWMRDRDRALAPQEQDVAPRGQPELEAAQPQVPPAANAAAAENNLKAVQENNAAMARLREELVKLTNKLSLFDDAARGQAQPDPIQRVSDARQASGQSLVELAEKTGLTQRQTVALAQRVIAHQERLQPVIASLHARLEMLEAQGLHLRNQQGGQG